MKEVLKKTAEETKNSWQGGEYGDIFEIGHETLLRMTKNKLIIWLPSGRELEIIADSEIKVFLIEFEEGKE